VFKQAVAVAGRTDRQQTAEGFPMKPLANSILCTLNVNPKPVDAEGRF
jgi:hypothetical protein